MPIVVDNPRGGSLTMGLFSNRTINIGIVTEIVLLVLITDCLLYTSPSPRD